MATWKAVVGRCAGETEFELSSADEFQLLQERREVNGTLRAQRVWVRRFEAWGAEMIEIRSAFAKAETMDSDAALLHNLDLPIGAIARHGDVLVLILKLPLDPIDVDGVLFAVQRVSMVADVLEAKRGTDRF